MTGRIHPYFIQAMDYGDTKWRWWLCHWEIFLYTGLGKFIVVSAATPENKRKGTSHYSTHFDWQSFFWEVRCGNTTSMSTKQQRWKHNQNTRLTKYKDAFYSLS